MSNLSAQKPLYCTSTNTDSTHMVALDPINKVVKLLASAPSAEAILSFRPSEEDQLRFDQLIAKKKTTGLSIEEAKEAENFLIAEHMMRMAKLYALERKKIHAN